MNRILVPIDFSNAAELVIKQAIRFAKFTEGKVMLIHVASPEPDFIGDDVGPQVLRDQKAKRLRDQHQQIQEFAKEFEKENIQVTPLLIQGVTVDEIINEQKKFKSGITIMGSHGHTAMYNLLMGSVVEGVIRKSNVPVMVIPIKAK